MKTDPMPLGLLSVALAMKRQRHWLGPGYLPVKSSNPALNRTLRDKAAQRRLAPR